MTIQSIFGVLLIIAGAALLYFGYQESQGVGEQVYETFAGRFTDSTTWYLVAGSAATIGGVIMLIVQRGNHA